MHYLTHVFVPHDCSWDHPEEWAYSELDNPDHNWAYDWYSVQGRFTQCIRMIDCEASKAFHARHKDYIKTESDFKKMDAEKIGYLPLEILSQRFDHNADAVKEFPYIHMAPAALVDWDWIKEKKLEPYYFLREGVMYEQDDERYWEVVEEARKNNDLVVVFDLHN